ncbi:MAG TPA: nuclear transport factor 2 family protein [Candidatus Baltobacteraceae bacterium]
MKIRFLATALLCAAMCAPASAATAPVPAAVTAIVHRVMTAANTANPAGLSGLYAADAGVVDENAPYYWTGTNAGRAWLTVVDNLLAKMKATHFKAVSVAPTEYQAAAGSAYLIVPVVISGNAGKKSIRETGLMTLTLRKTHGTWQITSQIWTTT